MFPNTIAWTLAASEVMRNLVENFDSPRPACRSMTEYRGDRLRELILGILGELLSHSLRYSFFELATIRSSLPPRDRCPSLRRLLFVPLQEILELAPVDVLHDTAEHCDQPTVGVPGEPIVGPLCEDFDRGIVSGRG